MSPPPRASYFVCGSNRCGTTLLCELLSSTGVAGMPDEYFWPGGFERIWQEWDVASYPEYFRALAARAVTPNGIFGAKIVWGYMPELLAELRSLSVEGAASDIALIERWFPSSRYVWMWRDDVVAQAVSWAKALQTGQWRSHQDRQAEPAFDFEQIDNCVRMAVENREGWERWFAQHGVTPLAFPYERLVSDPAGMTRQVLEYLGVSAAAIKPTTATARQGDQLNEDWARRYRELAGRS